jgi:hypothetical protein
MSTASSSREQSEEPTSPTSPTLTDDFAREESFSLAPPPPTHRRHRFHSWLLYWASITPLICGGLGPTLTLMAISGCADKWRSETFPNGITIAEEDPIWVCIVTALAIVIGFIANIFLLIRMMGRGNPKHLQYGAIILWILECTPSSPQLLI